MALIPYSGTLGTKRAAHLLRRATFGATKQEIDDFAGLNVQEAVSRIFGSSIPDPPLPIDPLTGETWVIPGGPSAASEDPDLQEYFKEWYIGQMLAAGIDNASRLSYACREKITLFFHTHFTTMQSVVSSSRALYDQNSLFRKFAMDKNLGTDFNIKDLTKKLCIDNAMLIYLDGRLNEKGNPNENFGRELFELFSIGRGLEGTLPELTETGDYYNYKEEDVKAAARVLSGFENDDTFNTIDIQTGLPRGAARGGETASQHDMDEKQFSERFDHQIIKPDPVLLADPEITAEMVAIDEISQLIDMIYSREETAKNICRKIYRFYVYHEITQDLNDTVIADMAITLAGNGFKIQPVIEELLMSQHFYDAGAGVNDNNFGGIIKSPLDLILGFVNFFQIPVPDYYTDITGYYNFTGNIIRDISYQGLNFYEPYEVAGYAAYHQFPIYNRNWISTNYLTRRYEFISQVMDNMEMSTENMLFVDMVQFIKTNFPVTTAENAESLIIALVGYLFPVSDNIGFGTDDANAEITSKRLNYFLQAFLYSPQIDDDPLGTWTFRWNTPVEVEVVINQVKNLMNALLQSPEYQLM